MSGVYSLPYQFVDYLKKPGLDTIAGHVPLRQYLSGNPKHPSNQNIQALLVALRAQRITDGSTGMDIDQWVGRDELALLAKGQGHPTAFVAMMNFLAGNKHKLMGGRGVLKQIYDDHFRGRPDKDALTRMVDARYFGLDCIGFVANFLQYVHVWDKYEPYKVDWYDRYFTRNVRRPEDVAPLDVMVMSDKHVAIVDWVHEVRSDGSVDIDMCQSSTGGSQCNEHVTLRLAGDRTERGYTLFNVSGGGVPVPGLYYLMRRPDVYYQHPHQVRPNVFPAAARTEYRPT